MNFSKHLGLERSQRAPSHRAREEVGSRADNEAGKGKGESLCYGSAMVFIQKDGVVLLQMAKLREFRGIEYRGCLCLFETGGYRTYDAFSQLFALTIL